MAEEFHRALRDQGCEAQFLKIQQRNHNSIIFRAIHPDDPAARVLLTFIRRHAAR
jgi:hypothetical protein